MKACIRLLTVISVSVLLTACASGPDHFHRLQALPASPASGRQQFAAEVSIHVGIPSLVDRSQMVLDRADDVVILEHERWAAPLIDQLHSVLGQDLEQRRPDTLITSRPLSQAAGVPRYAVQAEIVALTLRRASEVVLEVRWRVDPPAPATARSGRERFSATAGDSTAAALATALSECVAALADRLAPLIGPS